MIDAFIEDCVYFFKGLNDTVFVCISCYEDAIGKLEQYRKNGDIFEKTGIAYFLSQCPDDSLKSLFINPEKYDLIGRIGFNFEFSKDENRTYLLRSKNAFNTDIPRG